VLGWLRLQMASDFRAMHKQWVFVGVVGFSDVERHALNTVFRLSEDRDLSYAPWTPPGVAQAQAPLGPAQVLLVDGESAEAVLAHARELPAGQRLIWVGADAPPHAWRVLERPIAWSDLLHDLDAVYAAHQVDSGYLDLDIFSPAPLGGDARESEIVKRRALLVGVDAADAEVVRSGLARVQASEIDAVFNTDLAVTLMGRNAYCCAVFNLDEHQVDAWALARLFRTRFPKAKIVALSATAGPLGDWWSRRCVRRNSQQAGVSALLARPLLARDFTLWIDRL
jgi:hypothetical protein